MPSFTATALAANFFSSAAFSAGPVRRCALMSFDAQPGRCLAEWNRAKISAANRRLLSMSVALNAVLQLALPIFPLTGHVRGLGPLIFFVELVHEVLVPVLVARREHEAVDGHRAHLSNCMES